jgi:ABC-type nitrate/sulfonate/bicarbonate transport system substrate-binding protein
MTTLKIAGVPEHFNLPWHLCIENHEFQQAGIDLQWKNVPEGTGKLCQMLRDGSTDVAVILTEGIIKDIIAGNPSKIVQQYVESPLIWGIHVAAASKFHTIADLQNRTAAISRIGSGSELMAYVNAANNGWQKDSVKLEIVNTIDGAVEALTEGRADYFMWERFMTKPLVDSGIFRRVGDCLTPWPSFVIAVRDDVFEHSYGAIAKMLQVINKKTVTFKEIANVDQVLADRFNQRREDIKEWLKLTVWSQDNIDEALLNKIQNQLFDLSVINKRGTFAEIVSG